MESVLLKNFRFQDFRPGQEKAIQSLLEGRHTLVVMPTGSGKSLIYQLTSLFKPGVTLVISPLIALMKNQVDSLKELAIPATYINSSLSRTEINQRMSNFTSGQYRLVYIAPERLRSAQFLEAVQQHAISMLVVDEAHCISEWGHDFRPDYLHIAQFREELNHPLTVALTATATPKVQDDIIRLLGLTNTERVITGFNRPNLALEVRYESDPTSKYKALLELVKGNRDGAIIIYTGTRRDAEEAVEFVKTVALQDAEYYHAGLSSEERTRVQEMFLSGDLSIVAATNAFGMGIDRPDVRQVIHFSLPGSLEAYYQEAGRAGRDGLQARAVLLYSPEDRSLQEWFIANSIIAIHEIRVIYDALRQPGERKNSVSYEQLSISTGLHEVKIRIGLAELERSGFLDRMGDEGFSIRYRINGWKESEIPIITERLARHQANRKAQLQHMIVYAESNMCRRQIILNHFGDPGPAEAEICCDNCVAKTTFSSEIHKDVASLEQHEKIALVILDLIRRLSHGVGREKLAQILKGSKSKNISRYGLDKSVYYGRLSFFSLMHIIGLIDELTERRYLKVVGGKYPVLVLTPNGETALRETLVIQLTLPENVNFQQSQTKSRLITQKMTVSLNKNDKIFIPKNESICSNDTVLDLIDKLKHKNGNVRRLAASALGRKRDHRATIPLVELLKTEKKPQVRQYIVIALGRIGDISVKPTLEAITTGVHEKDYTRQSAKTAIKKLRPHNIKTFTNGYLVPSSLEHPNNPVNDFLSRAHPRKLPGPWKSGWALDFHSQFVGAEWKRSQTGELAYRLKYQEDLTVLPALVDQAEILVSQHPELAQVDAVIPVPPSTPRLNDPVNCFTQAFAQRLNLKYQPILEKSRTTSVQKEMHTLAQKKANVVNAFKLTERVQNMRVLVIDDLFDSGATLDEVFRLLTKAQVQTVCVMTLTRSIHTDA
jgi:ATP-dependent DNA helicase RecQ